MWTDHVSAPIKALVRALDTDKPVQLSADMIPVILAAGDMGLVAFVPPEESPHAVHDPSAFGVDPHIALTKGQGTTFALLIFESKHKS